MRILWRQYTNTRSTFNPLWSYKIEEIKTKIKKMKKKLQKIKSLYNTKIKEMKTKKWSALNSVWGLLKYWGRPKNGVNGGLLDWRWRLLKRRGRRNDAGIVGYWNEKLEWEIRVRLHLRLRHYYTNAVGLCLCGSLALIINN